MSETEEFEPRVSGTWRAVVAFAIALAFALGAYLLIDATQPSSGLVSFSFLLLLPAAISAFIVLVADVGGKRGKRFYFTTPLILLGVVVVASLFILREGVICVIILAPLWLASSYAGVAIAWRFRARDRRDYDNIFNSSLLVLPLLAVQIEPYVPLPETTASVTRTIVVDATPDRIWPLLRGIPDVRPHEGAWNLSQDVIGIPRPLGAHLVGEGIGAERLANWSNQVRFRERVNDWEPNRRIGWRFIFDGNNGWEFTDRHLMPDSPYFRVTTGGYAMTPLSGGRTKLTIYTNYWIKTPVNAYSKLWGQLFLGDVEVNLLALVKGRAERR